MNQFGQFGVIKRLCTNGLKQNLRYVVNDKIMTMHQLFVQQVFHIKQAFDW